MSTRSRPRHGLDPFAARAVRPGLRQCHPQPYPDAATAAGDAPAADIADAADGGADSEEAADSSNAEPVGLAVIHGSSDYTSSLLSLVDPATATLVHDNCLNSGSVAPQLSQALSGSVVLPSAPLPGHPLVLIDSTNSALVWVNPADCTVVRQLSVSTGFKAYPHDVVAVSPNKFYVTRYMTNSSPTADPSDLDEGGDLLILDLDLGKAVARIDLAPYAAGGVGINPNPDRARVLDGKIYVTLNNLSADMTTQAGPGRVVVVDPATDTVSSSSTCPTSRTAAPSCRCPGKKARWPWLARVLQRRRRSDQVLGRGPHRHVGVTAHGAGPDGRSLWPPGLIR